MSGRSSVCLVFTLHRLHPWRVPHRPEGDRALTHLITTAQSEQPLSSAIDCPFFSVTTCLDNDLVALTPATMPARLIKSEQRDEHRRCSSRGFSD
jgi:hypothetical protein